MSRPAAHPLARAIAWLAAACVLLLVVLTVSPQLHAGMHGHDETAAVSHDHAPVGDPAHVCAVTLFAAGLTALLWFCLLLLGRFAVRSISWSAGDETPAAYPPYRLVPAHGPPAA